MNHKLVATFANEHGKQHNWTYTDVDTDLPAETIKEACELLTTLDIFEQNGVKLFDSVVTAKIVTTIEHDIFDKTMDSSDEAVKPTETRGNSASNGMNTVEFPEGLPAFEANATDQPEFPTTTLPNVPLHQQSSSETLPKTDTPNTESFKNSPSDSTGEDLSPCNAKDSPPKSRKRLLSSLLRREKKPHK